MRVFFVFGLAFALASACGPATSSGPTPPAPPPKPRVYRTVERLVREFPLGEGCASGPFALTFDLPPVHEMTRVRIYSIAERPLPIRFEVPLPSATTWMWREDPDDRCHARTGEEIVTGGGAVAASPSKRAPAAASAPPAGSPRELAVSTRKPSGAERLHGEINLTAGADRQEVDLDEDGCRLFSKVQAKPVHVVLWLNTVQRLDGAVVRVVVEDIEPTMPLEKYRTLVAERMAHDKVVASARAAACKANPQDRQCWIGCERANQLTGIGPSKPEPSGPPPARPVESPPPPPMLGAIWIAGSWRASETKWVWEPGFWRRPELPAKAVVAPTPPPPPKLDPPPPPMPRLVPASARVAPVVMVWVPGYWAWAGHEWVWIVGAWRAAPPAARFMPPVIVRVPNGFSFSAGRWVW